MTMLIISTSIQRQLTLLLCFLLSFYIQAQTNLEDQINSKVFTSLTELKSFVSIPNDALNKEDINRNLDWLKNAFEKRGFTTRKLGDFENGEKYYLQGLAIDPKHKGINVYLGELYVATNRHNLAVERLEVLKGCGCEEYDQLKAVIAGEKSKY